MNDFTVVLAHGLEGSPNGRKAVALREAGFEVVCPDGRGKVLVERIAQLAPEIASRRGVVLVGSSYGGLAALYLANTLGQHLRGLVLLAPALHHREPPMQQLPSLQVPADLPCAVVHGVHDDIVPIDVSRQLGLASPHVRLMEVDDDHRLTGSLGIMVECVRQMGLVG